MFDEPGMPRYVLSKEMSPETVELVNSPILKFCLRHLFRFDREGLILTVCVRCNAVFDLGAGFSLFSPRVDGFSFPAFVLPTLFGVEYVSGEGSPLMALVGITEPVGGLMM